MDKIGILTLYYNNYNYGGLLQAYALSTALQNIGFDAEQICFDSTKSKNPLKKFEYSKKEKIIKYGIPYICFVLKTITKNVIRKKIILDKDVLQSQKCIEDRYNRFKDFEQKLVRHSDKVYDSTSISEANEKYGAFICGSDQIWNPSLIRDEYLLKFVNEEKIKIAYSASIARSRLNQAEQRYIKESLRDFNAVSVREKSSVVALGKEGNERITYMPDPTFLLTKDEWNQLLDKTKPQVKYEKYIFCYLLGSSIAQRKMIIRYAEKVNKKVVFFPHIHGKIRSEDIGFPCIEEYDCGPDKFIALIKSSDLVITDSFHAVVFSLIYEKRFVALKREKTKYENDMLNRIVDLLDAVGLRKFLIKNNYYCLCRCQKYDYNFEKSKEWINLERNRAYDFLCNALKN